MGSPHLWVAEAQGNDGHEEQSNKPDQESACYLTTMTAYRHADHLSAMLYDRLSGSCRHASYFFCSLYGFQNGMLVPMASLLGIFIVGAIGI